MSWSDLKPRNISHPNSSYKRKEKKVYVDTECSYFEMNDAYRSDALQKMIHCWAEGSGALKVLLKSVTQWIDSW